MRGLLTDEEVDEYHSGLEQMEEAAPDGTLNSTVYSSFLLRLHNRSDSKQWSSMMYDAVTSKWERALDEGNYDAAHEIIDQAATYGEDLLDDNYITSEVDN